MGKIAFIALIAVIPLAVCAAAINALPKVGPAHGIKPYRPPQLGPWPPTAVKVSHGEIAYRQGDYATAFREWSALSRQGDTAAQYNLAVLYTQGRGVERNTVDTWEGFRKAAARGYAPAQEALGNMYGYGIGVPLNYPLAYALKTAALEPHGLPTSVVSAAWPGCATATDKSSPLKLLHAAMTQWFFCQAWKTALKIQVSPLVLYDMHLNRPGFRGGYFVEVKRQRRLAA